MLYIIYKTTNTVNGKIYIGVHRTADLNDGYMGSGKLLKRAIAKYGKSVFHKEIMFVFDTEESMLLKERELVNEDFLKRSDVYNLKLGGEGSWSYVNATIQKPKLITRAKKGYVAAKLWQYRKPRRIKLIKRRHGCSGGWNNNHIAVRCGGIKRFIPATAKLPEGCLIGWTEKKISTPKPRPQKYTDTMIKMAIQQSETHSISQILRVLGVNNVHSNALMRRRVKEILKIMDSWPSGLGNGL